MNRVVVMGNRNTTGSRPKVFHAIRIKKDAVRPVCSRKLLWHDRDSFMSREEAEGMDLQACPKCFKEEA